MPGWLGSAIQYYVVQLELNQLTWRRRSRRAPGAMPPSPPPVPTATPRLPRFSQCFEFGAAPPGEAIDESWNRNAGRMSRRVVKIKPRNPRCGWPPPTTPPAADGQRIPPPILDERRPVPTPGAPNAPRLTPLFRKTRPRRRPAEPMKPKTSTKKYPG